MHIHIYIYIYMLRTLSYTGYPSTTSPFRFAYLGRPKSCVDGNPLEQSETATSPHMNRSRTNQSAAPVSLKSHLLNHETARPTRHQFPRHKS